MSDSAKVRELHGAVREWVERSAVAQKNEHLRASLPYVDLMFAFGSATLGDHPTANELVGNARRVMEGPIPEGQAPLEQMATTAALVRNFMFKALNYRVQQALNSQPFGGPLSAEVLAARDEIIAKGGPGPVNSPHKLAMYVIDRFREQSRIAEPQGQIDAYVSWDGGDSMKRELAALHGVREPAVLAERIRKLYREGVPSGWSQREVRFYVLHDCLPLAPRAGEAFTLELLGLVPAALQSGTGTPTESPDLPKKQAELLERAMFLAAHFNREDIVTQLVDAFTALVRAKPAYVRYKFINVVARQCLRSLHSVGLTDAVDRFLTKLYGEVLCGATTADLKKKHAARPDEWVAVLQTLVNIAGGWTSIGLQERAAPILAEARNELLNPSATILQPKDYTELARAYVAALGEAPSEVGVAGMIELFRTMDPRKISNTWTTAQYYSRFHLNLVEDTVLTVCRPYRDAPAPIVVQ